MFPRYRSTQPNGLFKDFFKSFLNPVHFLLVPFVSEEGGVQVAVAHVTKGADFEAILFGRGINETDHASEFAPGNGGIFEDSSGGDASQSGKGRAAGAGP